MYWAAIYSGAFWGLWFNNSTNVCGYIISLKKHWRRRVYHADSYQKCANSHSPEISGGVDGQNANRRPARIGLLLKRSGDFQVLHGEGEVHRGGGGSRKGNVPNTKTVQFRNENATRRWRFHFLFLVARGGIEPPTQGFSKQGSITHACAILAASAK
jgi:hypothetical protein